MILIIINCSLISCLLFLSLFQSGEDLSNRRLQLLQAYGMAVLNLAADFRLGIFHFHAIEQVADAEETDSLPHESEYFHL